MSSVGNTNSTPFVNKTSYKVFNETDFNFNQSLGDQLSEIHKAKGSLYRALKYVSDQAYCAADQVSKIYESHASKFAKLVVNATCTVKDAYEYYVNFKRVQSAGHDLYNRIGEFFNGQEEVYFSFDIIKQEKNYFQTLKKRFKPYKPTFRDYALPVFVVVINFLGAAKLFHSGSRDWSKRKVKTAAAKFSLGICLATIGATVAITSPEGEHYAKEAKNWWNGVEEEVDDL